MEFKETLNSKLGDKSYASLEHVVQTHPVTCQPMIDFSRAGILNGIKYDNPYFFVIFFDNSRIMVKKLIIDN